MPNVVEARKRAVWLHQTCRPVDQCTHRSESRRARRPRGTKPGQKKDSCKSGGTQEIPHKKTSSQNSNAWGRPRAGQRESHPNTCRELACDRDKRGSCGSVQNAQHMKQKISAREVRRQRETRGSMTTLRCWMNQRTTPWPEAAMKTFTKKVDTAQSTTQWCWRPPTNRRGKESPRPQGVKPDRTNSRPRCCKLRRCGARAHTANQ